MSVAPAGQGGLNYGWRIMEGLHCFNATSCSSTGLVQPVVVGQHFYSDYCSGWIRSFSYANGAVTGQTTWSLNVSLGNVLSFGEDSAGELYVLSAGGSVYRIAPAP